MTILYSETWYDYNFMIVISITYLLWYMTIIDIVSMRQGAPERSEARLTNSWMKRTVGWSERPCGAFPGLLPISRETRAVPLVFCGKTNVINHPFVFLFKKIPHIKMVIWGMVKIVVLPTLVYLFISIFHYIPILSPIKYLTSDPIGKKHLKNG